ncbi:sensor histidine kinase [Streptomyces sp. NPDC001678]|uniref:sensor histidine kinase n=1 Tax=Streptomyces sp. NPDC001678 TaxID=3364599 RepID=UPI00369AC4F0
MRNSDGHDLPAHRCATWRGRIAPDPPTLIVTAVLGGFLALTVCYVIASRPEPSALGAVLALVPLVFGVQLLQSLPPPAARPARHRYWTLGFQALLTYLPYPAFGEAWLAIPGFLAGSALLVLPALLAWPAFAATVASATLMAVHSGWDAHRLGWVTSTALLVGLVVYGLSRLTGLIHEVRGSRREFADEAVGLERQRFARDLHDLLGYSLATIAYKSELTRRLLPAKNTRAQQELTEILETARQALSDVRAVSHRYRDLSLYAETAAAESTLTAAGVRVSLCVDHVPLSRPVETALATVVREGVANMLRHSGVRRCAIELRRDERSVRLSIANDGVARPARARFGVAVSGGSGITNLRTRMEAFQGRLETEVRAGGWFRLSATVPLGAPWVSPCDDATGVSDSATVA